MDLSPTSLFDLLIFWVHFEGSYEIGLHGEFHQFPPKLCCEFFGGAIGSFRVKICTLKEYPFLE